ncbi:MAG: NADH-quinone oxidoreductase subunit I [Chloroflexi bacterium]|nr:NADH-quinone oxidoreductase subunit I [Chloroflexota bacterium]
MYGAGIAKGMMTTLWHFFFAKSVTLQYPEERLELPPWTRGRPRLIYDVDSGDLRCTACGACALACPVDVIKIEQHPAVGKGKVLDRFDLDMGGCIECALCVEACPFRAIVMAPDFEFGAYDREKSLVFNMHELRIAGTPEVDSAMEFIQGVKRGRSAQAGASPAPAGAAKAPAAAGRAPAAAGAKAPAAAAAKAAPATAPAAAAAAAPAAAPAGGGQMTAAQQKASSVTGPLGFTSDMAGLAPSDRAKIYKERAAAAGIGRPAPKE